MIELKLLDSDKFRIIMETLERIGIAKKSLMIIKPFCYTIRKKSRVFLVYYKEIVKVEMKPIDYARLNTVGILLRNWNMVEFEDSQLTDHGVLPSVYVLPFREKKKWKLISVVKSNHIKDFIEGGLSDS